MVTELKIGNRCYVEDEEFDDLLDDYFDGKNENTVLRSSWHPDLNFTVTATEPPKDFTFFSGQEYSFRMSLSINISNMYLEDDTVPELYSQVLVPPNKVWLRMICCDTLKVGFCDPFILRPPDKLPP